MQLLQRYTWNGDPKELGQLFLMRKTKDARELEAVCRLSGKGWSIR